MNKHLHLQDYLMACASKQRPGSTHTPIPAIVLGLCKHGLYLTRNFARQGIPVLAIESNLAQPSAHTRYGHKIFCPDLYGEALINILNELKQWVPVFTPIFPTNDRMVDVLLTHYSELSDHFRLPFPDGDLLRRLVIKPELGQLASEAGLNVPRSFSISSLESLAKERNNIRFPVAVKPALPMMSFKSRRCDDFETLAFQVEASARINEPLIVQEWIEGDDRTIMFGAYYISCNGKCLASYSGRKLMSYPSLTGHAAATESYDIGKLLEEGARFLQGLGYWGLCSIEYKGHTPNDARFIEVTVGRCDWWIMCCGINGVNIPLAAYNDLTGASVPFDNSQTSAYIWHDIEHSFPVLVENLIKHRWTLADCAKFLMRPKKEAILDFLDPFPFLYSVPSYFLGSIAKLFHILARALPKAG
jgi:D-aspartate ligase